MNPRTFAQYEARAHIIKALAHPARLLIVDELTKHSVMVSNARRHQELLA